MKRKSCPICSSIALREICRLNKSNTEAFTKFSELKYQGYLSEIVNAGIIPIINHCHACDFYFYQNLPSDEQLSIMYGKGTFLFDKEKRVIAEERKVTFLRELLEDLTGLTQKSVSIKDMTLLDFGSGTGTLAKIAADQGFQTTAYEPSLQRNEISNSRNLTFTNDLQSLGIEKFDIIILNQVLEHVVDPIATLRQLVSLSNKKTLVYVAVPNLNNELKKNDLWEQWPFNFKNTHIMAPFEHLNGFTPSSFTKAIDSAGLKPLPFVKNLSFSPRYALIKLLHRMFTIGGTTRVVCQIK